MTGDHQVAPHVNTPGSPGPRHAHNGGNPRWKTVYDAMIGVPPGEIISYDQLAAILDLSLDDRNTKSIIHQATRRAIAELEQHAHAVFQLMRGKGFQRVDAAGVIVLAAKHQRRALAEIDAGGSKVAAIDLTNVDSTTAALVRATGMAFARQASVIRNLDIRQNRLDTAMDALGHQVGAQTDRLSALEARVNAMAGIAPPAAAAAPPQPPVSAQPPVVHAPAPDGWSAQPPAPPQAYGTPQPPAPYPTAPQPPSPASPFQYASPSPASQAPYRAAPPADTAG